MSKPRTTTRRPTDGRRQVKAVGASATGKAAAIASPAPRTSVDNFLDALARRLRKHAKAVRSIGTRYGRNPEALLVEKDEVAAELDKLAAALEGCAN